MHANQRKRLVAELIEGNRRAAKSIDCPRCGAPCLRGDDHDDSAATVTVDAESLDPIGEMLAILDGRHTFDLLKAPARAGSRGHDLHIRYDHHIHGAPSKGSVHVLHRCERPA